MEIIILEVIVHLGKTKSRLDVFWFCWSFIRVIITGAISIFVNLLYRIIGKYAKFSFYAMDILLIYYILIKWVYY